MITRESLNPLLLEGARLTEVKALLHSDLEKLFGPVATTPVEVRLVPNGKGLIGFNHVYPVEKNLDAARAQFLTAFSDVEMELGDVRAEIVNLASKMQS